MEGAGAGAGGGGTVGGVGVALGSGGQPRVSVSERLSHACRRESSRDRVANKILRRNLRLAITTRKAVA